MDSLPDEITCKLYSYLGWKDRMNLAATSKRMSHCHVARTRVKPGSLRSLVKKYYMSRLLKDLDAIFMTPDSFADIPSSIRHGFMHGPNQAAWFMYLSKRREFCMEHRASLEQNRDWVKIMLAQSGSLIRLFSNNIRNDLELCVLACKGNWYSIYDVTSHALQDSDFLMDLIERVPQVKDWKHYCVLCKDPAWIKRLVAVDGCFLHYATDDMKKDPEIVNIAVRQNGIALQFASHEMRSTPSVVRNAILNNPVAIDYCTGNKSEFIDMIIPALESGSLKGGNLSAELKSNKRVVMATLKRRNGWYPHLRNFYTDDEVEEAAVIASPMMLKYVDLNSAQYDKLMRIALAQDPCVILLLATITHELMMIALRQDGLALQIAPVPMKGDKLLVMEAVTRHGLALQYASEDMKSDPEIAEAAIRQNPMALGLVARVLRENKELVRSAVIRNGDALQFALKCDHAIVKLAVTQRGRALQYASDELKGNKEIVKIAVARDGRALEHASVKLRKNLEIVKIAVAQNGLALQFASDELKRNRKVVTIAVTQNGMALQFASTKLQGDEEVVRIAVAQKGAALQYASYSMRGNIDIAKTAVSGDVETYQWVERPARHDLLIMMFAYKNDVFMMFDKNPGLVKDRLFMSVLVQFNPVALGCLLCETNDDNKIAKMAVAKDPRAYCYLSSKHQKTLRKMLVKEDNDIAAFYGM